MEPSLTRTDTHENCPAPEPVPNQPIGRAYIPLERDQREEKEGLLPSTHAESMPLPYH